MDEKGFVFTMDAVLMLIPIFIIAVTVSGLSLNVPHASPYYASQDAMNTLLLIATNQTDNSLNTIAKNITSGNIAGARNAAGNLTNILNSYRLNYNLTYYNITTGTFTTLVSNGTMSTANSTVSSSTRSHYNVIFRLYMWR